MTDCYLHHCTTHNEHIRYCTTHNERSLNREMFATNNIRVFRKLTPCANIIVANISAHVPKYRYRQSMVRLEKFLVVNFSAYQIRP